jgi:chromosome segregation ATPase
MLSKTTTFSLVALCVLLSVLLLWRSGSAATEKSRLESRVSALTQELTAARQTSAPAPPPVEQLPRDAKLPTAPAKPHSESASRAAAASAVKLNEDLAAARLRISDLESKLLSLEADRAALAKQRQQELTTAAETCRTQIADTQHSLETAQADLKSAQRRVALFESENENLRKSQASALKTPARASSVPDGELDELSRRRDGYLKSLIRRYREIDNDYRVVMRDPQGPRTTDPAMLRIQATLSQAEEDLRQIDYLNAKTLLVEKRQEKN